MSSRLPVLVDPWRLAEQGRTLEGSYALADMPRLAPLLVDAEGEAAFRLRFEADAQGRPVVRAAVRAVLTLTCQRCLDPLEHEVHSEVVLGLVSGVAEADRLPESYESLLVDGDAISPRDLVEEELLLAVPSVPRHAGSCGNPLEPAGPLADRPTRSPAGPFSVLAGLGRRSDDE